MAGWQTAHTAHPLLRAQNIKRWANRGEPCDMRSIRPSTRDQIGPPIQHQSRTSTLHNGSDRFGEIDLRAIIRFRQTQDNRINGRRAKRSLQSLRQRRRIGLKRGEQNKAGLIRHG